MKEVNLKINITEDCIMNCRYCPQKHEKIYFKKELVKPLVAFLKGIDKKLRIDFFGGEPLLSYDTIKYLVDECKTQRVPIEDFDLITNGVLSNKKKIDFLAKNKFKLQFSIDGTEEVHLKNRKSDKISVNSHQKIIDAVSYMRKKGYPYSVYAVFHTNTVHKLDETVRFLLRIVDNWKQISINPTIGFEWGKKEFKELNEALKRLIKRNPKKFHIYKEILCKKETDLICNALYIDHYGDIYPTNLFAYKHLSKPLHLTEIKDPKKIFNAMIREQEKFKDLEYDKEMEGQFRITRFINNFFDEYGSQASPEFKGKSGLSSRRKNKVLGADCIFEKKKWISITGLCNNNCMFCLDGGRPDKFHKDPDQIKKEIKEAKDQGNTKLILSGGDPTIHPSIIDFVQYAKKLSYNKIQVITNGRMFASKEFTDKIIAAGLDEVTFSIHNYNSKMHDYLTRVPGSFKQILKGVKNVFGNKKNMIVNTDTCITKSNYKYLPKIIKFIVEKVGINEVNLMSMVPQGNAWRHRHKILYDYKKAAPYVHKVIDYCIANNVVLWLSRFPAEYLEGYEEFIEDPYKVVDDIMGRLEILKDTVRPNCKGEKCAYCCINNICDDFVKINFFRPTADNYHEIITITKSNYDKLGQFISKDEQILLKLAEPEKKLKDYEKIVPQIKQLIPFLKQIDMHNISLDGVPHCVLLKTGIRNIRAVDFKGVDYQRYKKSGPDYLGLAKELARKVKIKKEACKECLFFHGCAGIYQNYVRLFGFKELTPIKNKEIRINLDCNQDCLFCNTDSNAENVILEKNEILELIDNHAAEGVNYLVLSGKEPTLDKNLIDYIKYAKKRGFVKIELQTNAVICSKKDYAKRLKTAGLTDAFVSLHAADEELSSKMTKAPCTFNLTLEGIKNLKDESINITTNIVVNSLNYTYIKSIVKFIHQNINPTSIIFSIVAPVVKAWENKEIIPEYSNIIPHLKEAFQYCKKQKINFRIPSRCGIPICFAHEYKEHHDEFTDSQRFSDKSDKIKNESCRECKYDDSCTGIWKNYAELYGTKELNPIKDITDIDINLGTACNNNCKFCMSQDPSRKSKFVDYDTLRKDVLTAALENYSKITFLGGEPTIHPKIIELVNLASKNKFKDLHIVSNGRRYSDMQFLTKLVDAGANRFSISVHSHLKEVEDYLTNRPGGFDEKVKGLKNLVKFQKKIQPICINILVNSKNYRQLDDTIKFFRKIGIINFRINSMMCHSGNSKINAKSLVPPFSKVIPIIEKILTKKGVTIYLGDFPPCTFSIPLHEIIRHIGEYSSDNPTNNIFYDIDIDVNREFFHWQERRKNNLKTKTPKCNKCRFNRKCEGVWKAYYELYKDDDLKPIK